MEEGENDRVGRWRSIIQRLEADHNGCDAPLCFPELEAPFGAPMSKASRKLPRFPTKRR